MTVELIGFTGMGREDENWHAADILIFTKATRLNMTAGLLNEVKHWPESRKLEELEYMATTIPSSWEFVDLTFLISGVTRAAAQQITRTRAASYAMQSMRVVDASDVEVVNPFDDVDPLHIAFDEAAESARQSYQTMSKAGAARQDARGILPLNSTTNLVAKYNLREFVRLHSARSSLRTQGEYGRVVEEMHELVVSAWPWSRPFFTPKNEAALKILKGVVDEVGLNVGEGLGWQIAKAMDLIR